MSRVTPRCESETCSKCPLVSRRKGCHVHAHVTMVTYSTHRHTRSLSFRPRYRSACVRSANAPFYPHSLYPRSPGSRSLPTLALPTLALLKRSDARFTLARPTLLKRPRSACSFSQGSCSLGSRSLRLRSHRLRSFAVDAAHAAFAHCRSRRPCSHRHCSHRPSSHRPSSTHMKTCGHGGMGRRTQQHAGQRMRSGGVPLTLTAQTLRE